MKNFQCGNNVQNPLLVDGYRANAIKGEIPCIELFKNKPICRRFATAVITCR
jgi:hypothetical protein